MYLCHSHQCLYGCRRNKMWIICWTYFSPEHVIMWWIFLLNQWKDPLTFIIGCTHLKTTVWHKLTSGLMMEDWSMSPSILVPWPYPSWHVQKHKLNRDFFCINMYRAGVEILQPIFLPLKVDILWNPVFITSPSWNEKGMFDWFWKAYLVGSYLSSRWTLAGGFHDVRVHQVLETSLRTASTSGKPISDQISFLGPLQNHKQSHKVQVSCYTFPNI